MITIEIGTPEGFDPLNSKYDVNREITSRTTHYVHPANIRIMTDGKSMGLAQELLISASINSMLSTCFITVIDPDEVFRDDEEERLIANRQLRYLYDNGFEVRIVPMESPLEKTTPDAWKSFLFDKSEKILLELAKDLTQADLEILREVQELLLKQNTGGVNEENV